MGQSMANFTYVIGAETQKPSESIFARHVGGKRPLCRQFRPGTPLRPYKALKGKLGLFGRDLYFLPKPSQCGSCSRWRNLYMVPLQLSPVKPHKMKFNLLVLASVAAAAYHSDPLHPHAVFSSNSSDSLEDIWDGLWPFQGINTFAHLEHQKCLLRPDDEYDIAIVGVPFDTAVSYRPGARFGPRAIRAASQRQTSLRGYNQRAGLNPYDSWATIRDCGDLPITPMDNSLAFKQMDKAFEELLFRRLSPTKGPPRYVALGGDHSVLLPHLRALSAIYGPINVVHFDAHLDTWAPDKYPLFWKSPQLDLNHGSMLWKAHQEGLTLAHNVHAGLRTKLSGIEDYLDDDRQSFIRIYADDIWVKGPQYVIDTILDTIPNDSPTYLSVDIDVLDPGFGSGTGTQEPGGWLPRELLYVLRHIDSLSIVGADVVEVLPAFDTAEITATNGAQVAYEIITSMVKQRTDHLVQKRVPEDLLVVKESPKGLNQYKRIQQQLQQVQQLQERLMAELRRHEVSI